MSDSNDDINKKKVDPDSNRIPDDKTRTSQSKIPGEEHLKNHPKQIGRYTIKRVIASGGMGTVFEALQENPKRPVAVKVIKSSLANESAIRRLEYEAQMLARLRHPGIAQIYEAGSFDDNGILTPFFAMEYIPNAKTITEYASDNRLNSNDRLQLIIQVCDAVHHGHQRGIVHRDLKPSNILVDSSGRVRIIDFGVARAVDADMRQAAGQTEYGQFVGTVQYMSPEQFDADPHDIDTRSDVYTLGLILYELLTGTMPYTTHSDKIFDFASEVREGRTTPLGIKDASFKGDLDAIVQKAMQRDRENRYQSAFGLAQDIRRFIDGDAVVAQRLGISYQFKVFARKNKIIIGLVGTAFMLLLAGVIITSSLLLKVEKERQKAEIAKQKAADGQQFLSEVLTSSFPYGYGDKVTVANILDRASQKLNGAFLDEPELEAELRSSLGLAYDKIGHYDQAERELVTALKLYNANLGKSNDKSLSLLHTLSIIYLFLGDNTEELNVKRASIAALTERFGASHSRTLESKLDYAFTQEKIGNLASAISTTEEVWKAYKQELGDYSAATLFSQLQYSWLLLKNRQIDRAEKLVKDVLDRSSKATDDKNEIIRDANSCLAAIYIVQTKIDSAQALYGNRRSPESFGIELEFQGNFDMSKGPFQLLVFFETWCPFSRLAMADLGKVDHQYNQLGLDIIGFTKVTKNAVDADVGPYLKELGAGFAVVKENGRSWNYFNCSGTPAIRLLYKGFLIWERGSYTEDAISTQMLEGLVAAQSCGF